MTPLQRFDAMMTYGAADRPPSWELGAWPQARQRWLDEGLPPERVDGDWFSGLPTLGMDPRIFAPLDFKLRPPFEHQVIEEDDQYVVARNARGIVTRALKAGAVGGSRMSMDQYLEFPVETMDDFRELRRRLDPTDPGRYPADWDERVAAWRRRDCPLVLGRNCSAGLYWNAREFMGTEHLSVAFFEQPKLVEAMMESTAEMVIEVSRRARAEITFDYFVLNEDIAFKSAPLLSPALFERFILPPMRRLIDELKRHGVRYIALDTDGNCEPLLPLWMDAGVDVLWPLEQAAQGMDPVRLRRLYGRGLVLWGGVDKRNVAAGPEAIDRELARLAPLVEDGGFVPHLDHTFPPDISRANFEHYLDRKQALLEGRL